MQVINFSKTFLLWIHYFFFQFPLHTSLNRLQNTLTFTPKKFANSPLESLQYIVLLLSSYGPPRIKSSGQCNVSHWTREDWIKGWVVNLRRPLIGDCLAYFGFFRKRPPRNVFRVFFFLFFLYRCFVFL